MNITKHLIATGLLTLAALTSQLQAQHGHLNAGVYDTNNNGVADQGDKLGFKNGDDWAYDFVSNSGYVHPGTATTVGNPAAYYGGMAYTFAITPTSLSGNSGLRATIGTGGAVTYAAWEPFSPTSNGNLPVGGASLGSFLQLRIASVELIGGSATSFSFWGPLGRLSQPQQSDSNDRMGVLGSRAWNPNDSQQPRRPFRHQYPNRQRVQTRHFQAWLRHTQILTIASRLQRASDGMLTIMAAYTMWEMPSIPTVIFTDEALQPMARRISRLRFKPWTRMAFIRIAIS